MCVQVLIKAISSLTVAFLGAIVLLFNNLKNPRKFEVVLGSILCMLMLTFSIIEFNHAFNPKIKTAQITYECSERPPYRIGENIIFSDGANLFSIYCDPITYRKEISGLNLIEGQTYKVTYEDREKMIIYIDEVNSDNTE